MATSRSIVTTALRKLGRVGGGREARSPDVQDGFEALVSLYRGWINSGTFGRLHDIVPTGNYMAVGNERILRTTNAVFEVTLPELVTTYNASAQRYYGTTITITQVGEDVDVQVQPSQPIQGHNVTPPRDLAPVIITDQGGKTIDFLYDGSLKKWVPIYLMDLDDEAPLSFRDSNGLASCLAINIADQWGADVHPATAQAAAGFRSALVTRFSTPSMPVCGVYF